MSEEVDNFRCAFCREEASTRSEKPHPCYLEYGVAPVLVTIP